MQAQKLLDDLDRELAAAGEARGEPLVWSAAEIQARELLADTVDRRADVAARYDRARDTKVKLKVSQEVRQLDKAILFLLNAIRTDIPAPESLTTLKARRAAMARWDRQRAQV